MKKIEGEFLDPEEQALAAVDAEAEGRSLLRYTEVVGFVRELSEAVKSLRNVPQLEHLESIIRNIHTAKDSGNAERDTQN